LAMRCLESSKSSPLMMEALRDVSSSPTTSTF
jgi:hypothetical protein